MTMNPLTVSLIEIFNLATGDETGLFQAGKGAPGEAKALEDSPVQENGEETTGSKEH